MQVKKKPLRKISDVVGLLKSTDGILKEASAPRNTRK